MKKTFEDIEKSGALLYKFIRGSIAHGINTPSSDIDEGGVYLAPSDELLGLGIGYQDEVHDSTNDTVWYELNKFMRLLCKSNPIILETLFIDDEHVIYEHPLFTEIKKHRDEFVTKECFKSFGGYATSQIKKARGLNKMMHLEKVERRSPLDFCYTFKDQGSIKIREWLFNQGLKQEYCGLVNIPNMHNVYGLYYDWGQHIFKEHLTEEAVFYTPLKFLEDHKIDYEKSQIALLKTTIIRYLNEASYERCWNKIQKNKNYKGIILSEENSNELCLSSVEKYERPLCYLYYNESSYSKNCVQYKQYQEWINNRNPVRYESNLKKKYDAKNMCECFRLLQMCIEIAKGEGVKVNRKNIDREFLLNIKNHKYEYEEIMSMLEDKENEMQDAIAKSTIKETVDVELVNNLLLDIRNNK